MLDLVIVCALFLAVLFAGTLAVAGYPIAAFGMAMIGAAIGGIVWFREFVLYAEKDNGNESDRSG